MKKMEMYKCEHCGAFFDEPTMETLWEYRGEYFGVSSNERVLVCKCPECGTSGMITEAETCEICGKPYLWGETESSICPDCMAEHNNIDFCYDAGKDCTKDVELNGFLASMFSREAIEEILLRELKKANETIPINCLSFIEQDPSWFGDRVIEEVKNK